MSGRFGNATAMAMATAIRTVDMPAINKPTVHKVARHTQASGSRRGSAPALGWMESPALDWVGIKSFVRSRQHYKNRIECGCESEQQVLLPHPGAIPLPWSPRSLRKSKASAFGNARIPDKWKNPLRDKELTDSIQVNS